MSKCQYKGMSDYVDALNIKNKTAANNTLIQQ
jgi:hypothetical protein